MMSHKPSKVVRVVTAVLLGVALAGPVVTPLVAEASANSTQGTLAKSAEVIDFQEKIECKTVSAHQWVTRTQYKTITYTYKYRLDEIRSETKSEGYYCKAVNSHPARLRVYRYYWFNLRGPSALSMMRVPVLGIIP